MGGRWHLGAKALSGSGSAAGGGLTRRAARWSVRTGQSGRAGAQARALERTWREGHKEGSIGKTGKKQRRGWGAGTQQGDSQKDGGTAEGTGGWDLSQAWTLPGGRDPAPPLEKQRDSPVSRGV